MASTVAPSAPRLSPSRARGTISPDSLVLAGVFGLLFFAPLAFGATESWSVFVLEAGTILIFAVWVWRQSADQDWGIRNNPLFKPMALFGAVVIVQLTLNWTAYRH